MDLEPYTGLGACGAAYEVMLRHDAHAPGSVDRVLQEAMVRLCAATADVFYAGPPAAPAYAPPHPARPGGPGRDRHVRVRRRGGANCGHRPAHGWPRR